MYWKQLAIVGAIVIVLPVTFYKGYESGKAHVQEKWNQQQVLDLQAIAIADNKTTIQVIKAQKVTQNENTKLKQDITVNTDYYSRHIVSGASYGVFKSVGEASSSQVSTISSSTEQPNNNTANAVSRADYEKLANDCLVTTLQLNNAQEWAAEQIKLDAE
jgi:hypothetical protein